MQVAPSAHMVEGWWKAAIVAASAVLVGAACGSDATQNNDDDGAGGTSTSSSGAGAGSTSSSGAGAGSNACMDLEEQASTQSVSVDITNGAATDRYVMEAGYSCDAVRIERLGESGYEAVVQSAGWVCGCECPGPPPPGPSKLRRIAPGETVTFSWDAREVDVCIEVVDCLETYGFEGTADIPHGFSVPVDSGEYRLTYQVFETLPEDCQEIDGSIDCLPPQDGGDCSGDLAAEASFILQPAGDASATVTIN